VNSGGDHSTKVDLRHVSFEGKPSGGRPPSAPNHRRRPLSPPAASPLPQPHDEFVTWVLGRAGLNASAYRSPPLQRRLSACLRALKVRSTQQARDLLERQPSLVAAAVGSLLIGVTEFFREPAVLESLRTRVLPELARRGRPLRIWSGACSNGAEVYSVAILLAEAGLLGRTFLLGTDCRPEAIEQARAAFYDETSLGQMDLALRRRYMESHRGKWRPVEALHRQVHWKVSDLIRRVEPGPWDIILWRNAAIYLTPAAAADAWRRLAAVLAPGGVLVVGKAERPVEDVKLTLVDRAVYRAPDA
jgi:chemotaxis protein methyltransferase CheR